MTAHNIVYNVFKVIMFTMISLLIIEVTYQATDVFIAYKRVTDIAKSIEETLQENNSIPDDLASMYEERVQSVIDRSNVVTKISWNLNEAVTTKGETHTPVNEANVRKYGDIISYGFILECEMRFIFFINGRIDDTRESFYTYKLDSIGNKVPALRNLK